MLFQKDDDYIFLPKSVKFNISNNAVSDQREKLVSELALGVLGNGRLNSVELEHEVPGFCTLLCVWLFGYIYRFSGFWDIESAPPLKCFISPSRYPPQEDIEEFCLKEAPAHGYIYGGSAFKMQSAE